MRFLEPGGQLLGKPYGEPVPSGASGQSRSRRESFKENHRTSARGMLLHPARATGAPGKNGRRARGPLDTRSVMAMQGLSPTMGERSERRGSIALVLLVAAGLIAAAAGLMLVGRNQAGSYVIFLLAILGMIGVFSLFAFAAGVLRISAREASDSVLEHVVERAHEGIVVTDGNGRVLYANAAYRAFSGAIGMHDVR